MTRTEIMERKGARKAQDIPKEVSELLNQGDIETVSLTEWLAIDHLTLIHAQFPKLGIANDIIEQIEQALRQEKKPSTMTTTRTIGHLLYETHPESKALGEMFDRLSSHPSDSIRCYAPYLVALDHHLDIGGKLDRSLKLVADTHFGVREVVWMALRPEIAKNLPTSLQIFSEWASSDDENIRRFTTESTRPRGVWCPHIESLKEKPEQALPLLNLLKADESKYVQDSVGNWLNDASKSRPEFVEKTCTAWAKESPSKATEKIIKRARRTMDKK